MRLCKALLSVRSTVTRISRSAILASILGEPLISTSTVSGRMVYLFGSVAGETIRIGILEKIRAFPMFSVVEDSTASWWMAVDTVRRMIRATKMARSLSQRSFKTNCLILFHMIILLGFMVWLFWFLAA